MQQPPGLPLSSDDAQASARLNLDQTAAGAMGSTVSANGGSESDKLKTRAYADGVEASLGKGSSSGSVGHDGSARKSTDLKPGEVETSARGSASLTEIMDALRMLHERQSVFEARFNAGNSVNSNSPTPNPVTAAAGAGVGPPGPTQRDYNPGSYPRDSSRGFDHFADDDSDAAHGYPHGALNLARTTNLREFIREPRRQSANHYREEELPPELRVGGPDSEEIQLEPNSRSYRDKLRKRHADQQWDSLDMGVSGQPARDREITRNDILHAAEDGAGFYRGTTRCNGGVGGNNSDGPDYDSDPDEREQRRRQRDTARIQAGRDDERRAQDARSREIQLGRFPEMETFLQTARAVNVTRVAPSTDHIRLSELAVRPFMRFMRNVNDYEMRSEVTVNVVNFIEPKVKMMLQARYRSEGIMSDVGWQRQTRKQIYSRIQAYIRPLTVDLFNDQLRQLRFPPGNFTNINPLEISDFIAAIYAYAQRFKALFIFMSINNEYATPPIDNKKNGVIETFLSNFPNSYGMSVWREMCTPEVRRYTSLEAFLMDYLRVVDSERDRAITLQGTFRRFGPLKSDGAEATAKAERRDTPGTGRSDHHGRSTPFQSQDTRRFTPGVGSKFVRGAKKLSALDRRRESEFSEDEYGPAEGMDSDDEWADPNRESPLAQFQLDEDVNESGRQDSPAKGVSSHDMPTLLEAYDQSAKPQTNAAPWGCFKMATTGFCDKAGKECRRDHTAAGLEAYCEFMLDSIIKSKYLNKPKAQAVIRRAGIMGTTGEPPATGGQPQTFRPKTPGSQPVRISVLQQDPPTPATEQKAFNQPRQFNAMQTVLSQLIGNDLPPMHGAAEVSVGDLDKAESICLLDSGANSANYVDARWLRQAFPEHEEYLRYAPTSSRVGDAHVVKTEHEIDLEVDLKDGDKVYPATLTFTVLEQSNHNLIIGLPSMCIDFFDLVMDKMQQARDYFLITGVRADKSNQDLDTVIKDMPYHDIAGQEFKEVFSQRTRQLAPEELNEFDVPVDSFPEVTAILDDGSTIEERQRQIDELMETLVNPDLRLRCEVITLIKEYYDVFIQSNFDGISGVGEIHIDTTPDMPKVIMPHTQRVPKALNDAFIKEVNRLTHTLWTPCESTTVANIVIAAKATEPWIRLCGNYIRVNGYILKLHWPIPIIRDALEVIARGRLFLEADIANSFHQMLIDLETSLKLAVSIPGLGTYRPTKMPEGVSSASEHLQRVMSLIFKDFIDEQWLLVIFDNLLVIASDEEDLLSKSKRFLQRCRDHNLFLKFKKCTFGFPAVNFFGYRVSGDGYHLTEERISALDSWQFPENTKKMQAFLGFTLFFAPFIPAYAEKTAALYECIHKDFSWKDPTSWKRDYKAIFENFKKELTTTWMINFPDNTLRWELFTDASEMGISAILFQIRVLENGEKRMEVIAIVSHKFSEVAMRWATIEKECYAIFYALKKLRRLLWGVYFYIYTDHANLQFLDKSEVPKLQRWANYMAGFEAGVVHFAGKLNPADGPSRAFGPLLRAIAVFCSWTYCGIPLEVETTSGEWMPGMSFEQDDDTELETVASAEIQVQATPLASAGPFELSAMDQPEAPRDLAVAEEQTLVPHVVQRDVRSGADLTDDELFNSVHGDRCGHFGIQKTYARACKEYPAHGRPIKFFQDRITLCPLCQKFRLGHNDALQPLIQHLKVKKRHAAVGADVLKITPPDKYGNIGFLIIVCMATKLVSLHVIRDETSYGLAVRFFQFYAIYGIYDIISVDPGSNISQSVVEELHRMLGMTVKISLVDRHEGNGAEGTGKQVIRHLKAIAQSERLKDRWGEPEIVALVQYILNSHVNNEASEAHTPFELTFGTEAAPYYQSMGEKIAAIDPADKSKFLRKLNADLDLVWSLSRQHQDSIIAKRVPDMQEELQNKYQPGDYVLHLESDVRVKLDADYSGPWSVIQQTKNTVECRHVSQGNIRSFHVSRLKPFFGTDEQAYDMATRDGDQFVIKAILAYRGDPDTRTTLEFQIEFADGDVRWLPWNRDIYDSQPYEAYCHLHKHLFPLLFTVERAKAEVKALSKQPMDGYVVGEEIFVNLRSFGEQWYQRLSLPDVLTIVYVVRYVIKSISKDRKVITIRSEIFRDTVRVDSYYMFAYTLPRDGPVPYTEVTADVVKLHRDINAKLSVVSKKLVVKVNQQGLGYSSDSSGDGPLPPANAPTGTHQQRSHRRQLAEELCNRQFISPALMREAPPMDITIWTDASPWGYGRILRRTLPTTGGIQRTLSAPVWQTDPDPNVDYSDMPDLIDPNPESESRSANFGPAYSSDNSGDGPPMKPKSQSDSKPKSQSDSKPKSQSDSKSKSQSDSQSKSESQSESQSKSWTNSDDSSKGLNHQLFVCTHGHHLLTIESDKLTIESQPKIELDEIFSFITRICWFRALWLPCNGLYKGGTCLQRLPILKKPVWPEFKYVTDNYSSYWGIFGIFKRGFWIFFHQRIFLKSDRVTGSTRVLWCGTSDWFRDLLLLAVAIGFDRTYPI